MGFVIIAILVLMMLIIFKRYRSTFSVVTAILLIFGSAIAALVWGMRAIAADGLIMFFNNALGARAFYHLMIAWFAADAVCGVLIIRNYIEYKKINKK
jgi:hypothetical protein